MRTKEIQENIANTMRHRQGGERRSTTSTGAVIGKTTSPLIQVVRAIPQHDPRLHHRFQRFIFDGIDAAPVAIPPENRGEIASPIDGHFELEEGGVGAVNAALQQVEGEKMGVQEYLLNFPVEDESKPAGLLTALTAIKSGLSKES